jgi:hypothetical protein
MSLNTGSSGNDAPDEDDGPTALVTPRRGRPRVAITIDALYRLGNLQRTQAEAAVFFGCVEVQRRLL